MSLLGKDLFGHVSECLERKIGNPLGLAPCPEYPFGKQGLHLG
jgi:hypothetical protein